MVSIFEGHVPWERRNQEPSPRIHDELTNPARKRLGYVFSQFATFEEIADAYDEYKIEIGDTIDDFDVTNRQPAKESLFQFIKDGDNDLVLTLMELLLNEIWSPLSELSDQHRDQSELTEFDQKIRRILVEEGILLRIRPNHKTLKERSGSLTRTLIAKSGSQQWTGEPLRFERLADETLVSADQEIRVLAKEEKWEEPLSGYNEAWELYMNSNFSYIIAEKLYNSVEGVIQKICVAEGWNTPEDGVSDYLDSMRNEGLFKPNDAMIAEWKQILGGIQIGIQRTGDGRKAHEYIDQDYVILLLHQVGAFLRFIITRYEDQVE